MCNIETKDVVVSIGNQQITGKDAIVTSFQIECNNDFDDVVPIGRGYTGKVLRQQSYHITIELECTNMEFVDFLNGKEAKKVSKKKIEDCSTRELLFAIREKVKRGEK
jgi:uncharacterized Fe-S cluster-containing protein